MSRMATGTPGLLIARRRNGMGGRVDGKKGGGGQKRC